MSSYYGNELQLKVVVIKDKTNKDEVDSALYELCDDDYNGDNGEEYVKEEALEKGYESNYDYYINETKFCGWREYVYDMLDDMNDYCEWTWDYEEIEGTNMVAISVAMI